MTKVETEKILLEAMTLLAEKLPKEYDEDLEDYICRDTAALKRIFTACKICSEALEASEKYKWHDLRKDPEDLPNEDGWVQCWMYIEGVINYSMDLYFYSSGNKFEDNRRKNVFEIYDVMAFNPADSYKKTRIYADDLCDRTSEVIAWRYIQPFEEDKE